MPDWHERKCVISLKHAQAEDAAGRLKVCLPDTDSVISVACSGNRIFIHYRFPDTTTGEIMQAIDQVMGNTGQRLLNRIKCGIIAFMESNERDYLLYSCGWQRYIEDIYMNHFGSEPNEKSDIRRQTWRKYK